MACPHLATTTLPAITSYTKVYKEECIYCFDDQDQPTGLDVCLTCFMGCCNQGKPELPHQQSHAQLHYQKTRHDLYVNIKRMKKMPSSPPKKITKLAIEADKEEEAEYITELKCYGCGGVGIREMPSFVQASVDAVIKALSAKKQSDIKAWSEEVTSCQHTGLGLVQEPKKTDALAFHQCHKCDIKENIWLCLTCGHVGCGRQQYGGIGGQGHGLSHFETTGHPVSVKMGTITPEGTADVFCYICGEERLDPELGSHLHHFGIWMSEQSKTVKSITELQLEQNLKFDFSMTTEDGVLYEPLFGPGFTGLKNLGNTCYMASVLQILFSLPSMVDRYLGLFSSHIVSCSLLPTDCFHCQMAKMAYGLSSGRYSTPNASNQGQEGISPSMFKELIGKGHYEFSTMRQQDAQDFLTHLLTTMEQKERTASGTDPSTQFQMNLQQKLQCLGCQGVKYSQAKDSALHLFIPAQLKPNSQDYEPISLITCLDAYFDESVSQDYACPHEKTRTSISRSSSISTFPSTLCLVMKRFIVGDDYVMKKLNVAIEAPLELSLEKYKTQPRPDNEFVLPEEAAEKKAMEFNQVALDQLLQMGFPEIRCQKALLATGNADAEIAMTWLFEHMEDPDIDAPLAQETASDGGDVGPLMDMGFTVQQAKRALKETGGNMERAVDWLFSHADEPMTADDAVTSQVVVDQLPATYKLLGFISHRGTSTGCGHYVAHVYKQGRWVLYNDNKVAHVPDSDITKSVSEGYVYFYQRV